jgi:hypothetical protein
MTVNDYFLFQHNDNDDDEDNNEDDDEDEEPVESIQSSMDWEEAELTLRQSPSEPTPDLDPHQVASLVCRSLQWVDYPSESLGLQRCFPFFTFECRKLVTARQGGETVERFIRYGLLSPALQPFMGASRIDVGEGTLTKAQPPLRGAIMSYPVAITGSPVSSLQYLSGFQRGGVAMSPPQTNMVLRLEQQRRPPNQDCWLVKEIMDVRHAFAGDMGNAGVGG